MIIYTIGFTKKSAEKFFSLLQENGVRRLLDIRLNPKGQLAGFAKQGDISYFLSEIVDCEYFHFKIFTPTEEILSDYQKDKNWSKYVLRFEALMDQRNVPASLDRPFFEEKPCCLLCSEEKPEKCHRRLVAERIAKTWPDTEVIHLI